MDERILKWLYDIDFVIIEIESYSLSPTFGRKPFQLTEIL